MTSCPIKDVSRDCYGCKAKTDDPMWDKCVYVKLWIIKKAEKLGMPNSSHPYIPLGEALKK